MDMIYVQTDERATLFLSHRFFFLKSKLFRHDPRAYLLPFIEAAAAAAAAADDDDDATRVVPARSSMMVSARCRCRRRAAAAPPPPMMAVVLVVQVQISRQRFCRIRYARLF